MNNEYNDLYDPSYNLATCITGQILIIELINKLYEQIYSFKIIQSNTDGIMFKINRNEWEKVKEIIHSWEEQHKMTMEEDIIQRVVQRDVNNYCMLQENGKIKFKGGALSDYNPEWDKPEKIRWKHNSLSIVAESLVKKMLFDTEIEETINECDDLMKFQIIGKTGSTYLKTVRLGNGEYKEIQKVNRIYAGTDSNKGSIYKVKNDKDKNGNPKLRYDKLANCPFNTLIDGYDDFNISDIDKQWYIDLAIKRFQEFIGGKKKNGKSKKS